MQTSYLWWWIVCFKRVIINWISKMQPNPHKKKCVCWKKVSFYYPFENETRYLSRWAIYAYHLCLKLCLFRARNVFCTIEQGTQSMCMWVCVSLHMWAHLNIYIITECMFWEILSACIFILWGTSNIPRSSIYWNALP